MIVWFIPFLLLFIILFFTSRALFKNLYFLFYFLTKNKNTAVPLLTFIFLPGIVIHEVSHMLIAEILRVKTGEFSFIPEIIAEDKIKAASVKISKTDPLRQTLIGLGPIIIGLTIIFSLSYFLFLPLIQDSNLLLNQGFKFYLLILASFYLIFIIANTMFSSAKDLEVALFPLVLFVLLAGAFWLGDFKISWSEKFFLFLNNLFKNLSLGLGLTIFLDFLILGLTRLINSVIIK